MEPILDIKPTFVPKQTWIECAALAFMSFMMLGTYPIMFMFMAEEEVAAKLSPALCIVLAVLLTVIPPIGYYFWKKRTYTKTQYQFFADKIIYQESFLNTEEKEFSYSRIAETALKRNVIQQFFNVGSVSLMTYATGGASYSSGLKLKDLDDPKEQYAKIKEILENAKTVA